MTVAPLLLRVAALLKHVGIDHAFMGGQAVIQWGEPRLTRAVDALILRQRGKLDLDYVRHWLPQLAEVADEPGIVERFEELLSRYYYPPERMMI